MKSDSNATRAPHRNPDGTFRNPWEDGQRQKLGGVFRWWLERTLRGVPADPDPSVFRRIRPAFRTPRAPEGVLTVTWIGHATTLIQLGGRNFLTDPMFGERASPVKFAGPRRWVSPGVALEVLPPIDAVLLTHNHYDHFDVGSAAALAARFPEAPWIVPVGLGPAVREQGVEEAHELDWWEAVRISDITVTSIPARHFSARGPLDRNRTLWCGFALAAGRRRVLFAGDSGYHPDFGRIGARTGPFNVMLLPIGAYEPRWFMRPVHVNPEEAVRAFLDLGGAEGGVMGAIHWGTFKLTDEPMDEPPKRAARAWAGASLPPERLWIPAHGETIEIG